MNLLIACNSSENAKTQRLNVPNCKTKSSTTYIYLFFSIACVLGWMFLFLRSFAFVYILFFKKKKKTRKQKSKTFSFFSLFCKAYFSYFYFRIKTNTKIKNIYYPNIAVHVIKTTNNLCRPVWKSIVRYKLIHMLGSDIQTEPSSKNCAAIMLITNCFMLHSPKITTTLCVILPRMMKRGVQL